MRIRLARSVGFALALAGCGPILMSPPDTSPPEAKAWQVLSPGVEPPAPGPEHAGDGPDVAFAVTKIFVGDRDRQGTLSNDAWKQFGFNIDGFITDCGDDEDCKFPAPHCRTRVGGAGFVFQDGDGGIDNSFGANIVPIFLGGGGNGPTRVVDDEIARGDATLLIAIDRLGLGADENPLTARFYEGAFIDHPKLDGTDIWPIAVSSVTDRSDRSSSRFAFEQSYVAHDTWVSGEGSLTLSIRWHGQPFVLPLHHAVVTMDLDSKRETATNGVISGIVDPDDLAATFRRPLGAIDKSLCDGGTIDSILNQVRQAADMMIDGRAGESDETCDGVSVGLGFEAIRVQLGDVIAVTEPIDPCAK